MSGVTEPVAVGGYRLGRRLDVAGSAETYQATGPGGEIVMLKVLRDVSPELADGMTARLEAVAGHPGLIIPSAWGRDRDDFYVVRDYIAGIDLGAAATAYYLSPEQIQSDLVIPQSDVYALGVILYELVTGAVPFDGFSAAEVVQKHLTMPPTPPSKRRAGVPRWIDKVVERALQKDPAARYRSVEEMRQALAGAA